MIVDLVRRTLLARHPDAAALRALAGEHGLPAPSDEEALEAAADRLLAASRDAGLDLVGIDDIAEQARVEAESRRLADRAATRR